MSTKQELAQTIVCRCLKVSAFDAAVDIRGQLQDLDQQATMETFLNVRIVKWLRGNQPGWSWLPARAQDLGALKTMGDFAAYVSQHLAQAAAGAP